MNSILMLGDCVGEQIGYSPYFSLQTIVILTVGDSYGLLVVDWVYYRSVTVKGVANMEKVMGLNLVGRSVSEVWQGKRRLVVASDQTN